ncbi:CatB-related O-acetyltransferase [Halobium salinum]|uniref:CatB-related O-acetyltransferase n=1 Tax=Halobium salinum TaxID=1364940 RepID=A0ABD5PAJ1_9EURY|nr:CatB-related O-acetyltransferase [Halobium salinum]
MRVHSGSELIGKINIGKNSVVQKNAKIHTDTEVEDNVRIGRNSYIQRGKVKIGSHTNLVRENEIYGDTIIGKFSAIAPHTVFQAENHPMEKASMQMTFYDHFFDVPLEHEIEGPITVGNDVWIGTNAVLLPGVSVGSGAVIGAGSIVTRDVEPYAIVAGSPAEHKKWRFDHSTRKQLLDIAWWEWGDEKIRANREFFETDLTQQDDLRELVR